MTTLRNARSRLHPPLPTTPAQALTLSSRLAENAGERRQQVQAAPAPAPSGAIALKLTTVSIQSFFDANIYVGLKGQTAPFEPMIVDFGNSMLVMPDYAALRALPNFTTDYQILAGENDDTVKEPFCCPAAIIRGPIEISTVIGGVYTIRDCVFFACKGPNSNNEVTSNFGIGCVPWTASNGMVMRSPLAFDAASRFVEVDFAPPQTVLAPGAAAQLGETSTLKLHADLPASYRLFDVVPDKAWMALRPRSLKIAGAQTSWPNDSSAIAMIDTGGGPVFLGDQDGYVYKKKWPAQIIPLPDWTQKGSSNCQAVNDDLEITLGDATGFYRYSIRSGSLPPGNGGKNYTLVICEKNLFMREEHGMNIGGISALFVDILIDYEDKRVGLKEKSGAFV